MSVSIGSGRGLGMDRSGRQPAFDGDGEDAAWTAPGARGNRPTSGSVVPLRVQAEGTPARSRSNGIRELALSAQEQAAFATGSAGAAVPLVLRPPLRRRSVLQYVFEREGWIFVRLFADIVTSLAAVLVVLSAA